MLYLINQIADVSLILSGSQTRNRRKKPLILYFLELWFIILDSEQIDEFIDLTILLYVFFVCVCVHDE